jgi:hypothetical protein
VLKAHIRKAFPSLAPESQATIRYVYYSASSAITAANAITRLRTVLLYLRHRVAESSACHDNIYSTMPSHRTLPADTTVDLAIAHTSVPDNPAVGPRAVVLLISADV